MRLVTRAASLAAAGLLGAALPAWAGPVVPDQFLQFAFDGAGSTATGCDPADPAGGFCVSSSGTVTGLLDAPPWTFTAGAGGATLTVVDVFESGDAFDVFDFGILVGSTSALALPAPVDCGDDPVVCLGTPGMSVGTFALGAGAHAITIVATAAPQQLGTGYLQVTGATAVPLPLPATLGLVLGALAALGVSRRRATAAQGQRP